MTEEYEKTGKPYVIVERGVLDFSANHGVLRISDFDPVVEVTSASFGLDYCLC